MRPIKYIVVHCSDSPQGRGDGAEDIHQWHKEKGWDGIGYHYVVEDDGNAMPGRPHYWKGAHVRNYNHNSLGICVIGYGPDFTDEQISSLVEVVQNLKVAHPNALVVGHYELDPNKQCPGIDMDLFRAAHGF